MMKSVETWKTLLKEKPNVSSLTGIKSISLSLLLLNSSLPLDPGDEPYLYFNNDYLLLNLCISFQKERGKRRKKEKAKKKKE